MTETLTTADILNLGLFIATTVGVLAAFRQISILNRQKRADLILQLYNQFYQDKDMQEIYYKIEYGKFVYTIESFHGSEEEKQLDKLLGLFSNISQLFQMKIVKDKDLEFLKYEFQTIYQYQGVQLYLQTLDGWFREREISHLKFQPFREVGLHIINKNNLAK